MLIKGRILLRDIDSDVNLLATILPLEDVNTFDGFIPNLFEICFYLQVDGDLDFRQSRLVSEDEIESEFDKVYNEAKDYLLGVSDYE